SALPPCRPTRTGTRWRIRRARESHAPGADRRSTEALTRVEAAITDNRNMRAMNAAATILLALTLPAFAGNMPDRPLFSDKVFFNGNDVYQWCQHDKASV